MSTFMAIIASIAMLATTAFGRVGAPPPTSVAKTAAYAASADNGGQAIWAAQYGIDHKAMTAMLTSTTSDATAVLTAGRGGSGMHGGFSGHATIGRGFHSQPFAGRSLHRGFSGHATIGRGFHSQPFAGRSFDRDRFMHRNFDHDRFLHRDFHRDHFIHRNFRFYPYGGYYFYPYGYYPYSYYYPYGYYPYSYYYPYGYYPYSYYYPYGYYYGNPWYFYPYFSLSFSW